MKLIFEIQTQIIQTLLERLSLVQKEIFEEIIVSHMPVGHTVSSAINYYFQWDIECGVRIGQFPSKKNKAKNIRNCQKSILRQTYFSDFFFFLRGGGLVENREISISIL